MGSFLNQASHDKATLSEGAQAILVLSAQEMVINDKEVIFGDFTPIFKMSVENEDYGYLYSKEDKLANFFLCHQDRFIDGKLSTYGISDLNDYEELSEYEDKDAERGEAPLNDYLQMIITKEDTYIPLVEKIKNGVVFAGDSNNHFYQIKASVFKKTTYDKAKKLSLLDENDEEISLKDFREKELNKIFTKACEKHEKFSAEWFYVINQELKHPLYYNENEELTYPHSEEKLKKVLIKYFKEYLELKYLMLMGLEFSPIKYAGQDYSNDIGKHMKKQKQKVAL